MEGGLDHSHLSEHLKVKMAATQDGQWSKRRARVLVRVSV